MDPIIPFEENIRELGASHSSPAKISRFAVVDSRARIDPGVEIGPFCVIGPDVEIFENIPGLDLAVMADELRTVERLQ